MAELCFSPVKKGPFWPKISKWSSNKNSTTRSREVGKVRNRRQGPGFSATRSWFFFSATITRKGRRAQMVSKTDEGEGNFKLKGEWTEVGKKEGG